MSFTESFTQPEPSREAIDALAGPVVLEFGTPWCGFCQAAKPLVEKAFAGHQGVAHIKVEDGSGRRLGRSFRIKLWPTLVFMRDGLEVARLVRPADSNAVAQALASIDAA